MLTVEGRESLYDEYFALMYHLHQTWGDIEEMPVYDRKAFLRKLREQREFEKAEVEKK